MGVHADISVYGWLKPTLTVELVAGGSLQANTKYYVCGLMGFTPATYSLNGGPLSDVHEITTTTTDLSIKVTHKTYRNITAFADNGDSRTKITSARHCVTDAVHGAVADTIKIATGSYAGTWTVDEWVDYDTFIINTTYIDNVPVQFYTDSQYYNSPLLGGNANQGMAIYISPLDPINATDGLFQTLQYDWDRRPWTAPTGGFANPKTYTVEPNLSLARYSCHPQLARMDVGPYQMLTDYGSVHVNIDGDVDFVDIYGEAQASGFIYNCGYSKGGYNTKTQFFLYGSMRAGTNSFLYEKGASITWFGDCYSIVNAYEDIVFKESVINMPSSLFSCHLLYTADGSVLYNNSTSNTYTGWIRGVGLIIYAAPRTSTTYGDVTGQTCTNLYDMSSMSYSIYQDKIFKQPGAELLIQNSYNSIVFKRCEVTPFYWILNYPDRPDIYFMEDCIIKWSDSYQFHFRIYHYTPTMDESILKFLNIDCPDNADNHKDVTHNSALNATWMFYRRIKFYIKDKNGVALQSAAVSITDDQSNTYSDTTDIDGYVYIDVLEQTDVMVDTEPAYTPPTTTILTDFVIKVSKPGYAPYQAELANLYTNEIQNIALQVHSTALIGSTIYGSTIY
jgi:hypothetical protein